MSESVTLIIKQALPCGHELETTVHARLDEAFAFSLKQDFPKFDMPAPGKWIPPVFPEPLLTLSSHYERVEMTGIALKDRKFICLQCGAEALFP